VGVGEQVHRQEEGLSLPFGSSLAAATAAAAAADADAANVDVPEGEEVFANNVINEEYREPPHPLGLVAIRWRSG
jgi:hypothetical protein